MKSSARPIVIAHRGASGYRPEHTRSAYELAFALGADGAEPDIVSTKDGVLVVRHENEIGGTTDVASHKEFARLRTTRTIDGEKLTGWFTEDFTWKELSTLRAIERLPQIRQASSTFDRREGILRLSDLVDIIDAASEARGQQLVMVAEIKHATHFESIGLPLDDLFAAEISAWATSENLIVESFEESALGKIRERGTPGQMVFLAEAKGSPADLVARDGAKATTYAELLSPTGLVDLSERVDGISVNKRLILQGVAEGTNLVADAHAAGLLVLAWTLRAENKFLTKSFRRGGLASDFGEWLGEFTRVLETGVDGVFADQPDLALAAIGALDGSGGGSGDAGGDA